MPDALDEAIADLVFGPALDLSRADQVASWLDRHALAAEDRAALGGTELRRLLVYRGLVRGTLRSALELAIPRSIARLGPAFDTAFDAFLADRGPRTHYLRDVTAELLDHAEPAWRCDPEVPPYVPELARLEALQVELGAQPVSERTPGATLHLDRALLFNESCRLLRFEHAVHELPESVADRSVPERRSTALFVYRDDAHDLRYLELSPLAADVVGGLLGGGALGPALRAAAAQHDVTLTSAVTEDVARLLADLAERGALLGAAP